jgi:DNA mismatch endonuclease (patch repair protein)
MNYKSDKTDTPRKFIRDGRSPVPEYEITSWVMSANKGKNTKPEIVFRKYLFSHGLRGYRIHWKKIPGRPDIVFTKKKVAIFINGCFWHRCPTCNLPLPKTNTGFWSQKFSRNQTRDKLKIEALENLGWKVLVIWECEIKRDIGFCFHKVSDLLNK